MTEDRALAVAEPKELQAPTAETTISEVLRQRTLVHELMDKAMVKDKHYGVIPGAKKPTLLKPGAEELMALYRLVPRIPPERVRETWLKDDHLKVDVVCALEHRVTGEFWGEGLGSCSTMESKYRWRYETKPTGKPVPKEYWKDRDKSLIGGKGFSTEKIDGQWMIVERGDKIENPDIADTYNTVLKIAKKRAIVDAVLTATAASEHFTQDVEDFREAERTGKAQSATPTQEPPAQQEPRPRNGGNNGGEWDGQLKFKSGKHAGKRWADMNTKFLNWCLDERPNDYLVNCAEKEIARRAKLEATEPPDYPEPPPEDEPPF